MYKGIKLLTTQSYSVIIGVTTHWLGCTTITTTSDINNIDYFTYD